jgi:hypothetical protein
VRSDRLARQGALFAGGLAIIVMDLATNCSKGKSDEVPSTSSATATPTDKGAGPGGEPFSPTVTPALPQTRAARTPPAADYLGQFL